MDRSLYLGWAAAGVRFPIGTHLVLQEHRDGDAIVQDGRRLAEVIAEAARRFDSPLAVPLMDLTLEKAAILEAYGIAGPEADSFHFRDLPATQAALGLTPRMRAACDGIRCVAQETDLLPVGMCIGPFSLTTKLIADPITPVFLAGTGATADEEPEVALLAAMLGLAIEIILTYLRAQIAAGARAVILCEPAANKVYFSPNQLARDYAVFDRLVVEPNRRITALLAGAGVDLIFHDCGELLDGMVSRFSALDPAILSLGSSRTLWQDAALVSKRTVLYGNLPSKRFYSDALITRDEVQRLAMELRERMRGCGHPFILGSECDVLSVPGSERTIMEKVQAFLEPS